MGNGVELNGERGRTGGERGRTGGERDWTGGEQDRTEVGRRSLYEIRNSNLCIRLF